MAGVTAAVLLLSLLSLSLKKKKKSLNLILRGRSVEELPSKPGCFHFHIYCISDHRFIVFFNPETGSLEMTGNGCRGSTADRYYFVSVYKKKLYICMVSNDQ